MPARPRIAPAAVFAVALFWSSFALADRAVVLGLAGQGTTKADLDGVRGNIALAAQGRGHTLAMAAEQQAAEAQVKDGVADTRDEYSAAGKAAKADWSVGGRVESRGHYLRIEVEACQVATGRVESLARNVEAADQPRKLGEMLGLLLRKEGIASATIPWLNEPLPVAPVIEQPPPPPKPPEPPPPPPPPPEPPKPPAPPRVYAENRPFAVGPVVSVLSAVGRPSNASGNATTLALGGSVGYAPLASVPGFEIRGDIAGGVIKPSSVYFAAGARYAWMALPRAGLYVGPEIQLGGFFPLGGDREGRFLLRGSPVVGVVLAEPFSVEAFGDVLFAPGGTGALTLVGGGLRGLVRF